MSDQLVQNIRKENYPLQIFGAFNGIIDAPTASNFTFKITSFIQDVYRSLEPSHFKGQLIIYLSLDSSILLDQKNAIKLFDRNILINNTANVLVLQYFLNEQLPLVWQDVDTTSLIESENALLYFYKDNNEYFIANRVKIDIINRFDCSSIYALQYHYLREALLKYKQEKIRYSTCSIFQTCWFDPTRIYFKQQPEEIMQKSLREFLDSALRGVDVVREYNLGASKPVDVRVYWKEANRAALIELKWLGQSKNPQGVLTTSYSNGRGNDGLDQIKEYMDLENQDTPTCITKGYLVIIDGRRRGVAVNPITIDTINGLHYSGREISFAAEKNFFGTMIGFEEPIRMFAEPICS